MNRSTPSSVSVEKDNNNTATSSGNPFSSPLASRAPSTVGYSSARDQSTIAPHAKYFHSRRIKKDERETTNFDKDPGEKWLWIIPIIGLICGIILAGGLVFITIHQQSKYNYCPVLNEDFSSGVLNPRIWTKEVEVGGYGNGQFEETTNTDENVYISGGKLYIKPTLQDKSLIAQDNVMNLTATGTCTSPLLVNCVTSTNITNGTIVQPVKSGRINTKNGATIKYGRVEVMAKIAQGDWLWPAIWMLPVTDTYGPWPASGEIDIMESRGNNHTYVLGGNDIITSSIHWGPNPGYDGFRITSDQESALHSEWGDQFHLYGLEWSDKYLFMYVDNTLYQVFYFPLNKPIWPLGDFPETDPNGAVLQNPWAATGRTQSPFDQEFYLVLNVAVGSTDGYFADGFDGKPWDDGDPKAKLNFWDAQDQWYPTWAKNGQMIVDSVKMWQEC